MSWVTRGALWECVREAPLSSYLSRRRGSKERLENSSRSFLCTEFRKQLLDSRGPNELWTPIAITQARYRHTSALV